MSKAKEILENLNKFNEEFSEDFRLTDLQYKITYTSGKPYEKVIHQVDTLNYKLYDLGLAQIADIVLKNSEDNGLIYKSEDSSYIKYDPKTGIIQNVSPISLTDDNGETKGTLSFKMILWTHPKEIEVL